MMQVTPTLNFNERSQFENTKYYMGLTLKFWEEERFVDEERLVVSRDSREGQEGQDSLWERKKTLLKQPGHL